MTPDKKRIRFWSVLGWLWTIGLAVLVLTLFFPVVGRSYQNEHGQICNENLELIFQAKEELARSLNLDPALPYPAIVQRLEPRDLAPFLKKKKLDFACPAGGKYDIQPLVDEKGEVVPPVCDMSKADPDGNGISLGEEGLHIHRRSHLQDVDTGKYFPDPALTVPNASPRSAR
jgi:hypothetical protein